MTFRDEQQQELRDLRKLIEEDEELEQGQKNLAKIGLLNLREALVQTALIEDLIARVDEIAVKVDLILTEEEPSPQLTTIKLKFTTGGIMAEGPVVLSSGQSTTATLDFFDAVGNPMPAGFVPPVVTFTIDNAAVASSTPGADGQSDVVAYVAAGTAKLTASVTSAEGLALSDTETVTCSPVVLLPPVLTSVRLNFGTPTP